MVIARNIEMAYTHAAVAGGLFMLSLGVFAIGSRRRAVPALLLCLLAVHPAWTISALSGDCGYLKRDASWGFTVLGSIAISWQMGRSLWARWYPKSAFSSEEYLRAALAALSEQQRNAIRQMARSGRIVEAIQEAECLLGVSLASTPNGSSEQESFCGPGTSTLLPDDAHPAPGRRACGAQTWRRN
jgi:uncharacterized membrane protein